MPVILAPGDWPPWPGEPPAERMMIWPVDRRGGSVANKDWSLIEPKGVAQ
jgi:hypothetical protein